MMLRRLFGTEARIFEWVCVIGNVCWGGWLLNPHIDFNRPAYVTLTALLSQQAWAALLVSLGIAHATALIGEMRSIRQYTALFQAAAWVYVALTLGLQNFNSTAFPTYSWIAAIHVVLWLRLAVIAR